MTLFSFNTCFFTNLNCPPLLVTLLIDEGADTNLVSDTGRPCL